VSIPQHLRRAERAVKDAYRRQKTPDILPIFKADKVTLHVSRQEDGKLRLVHARLSRTVRRRCYTPDWRVVCERRPFPCHP